MSGAIQTVLLLSLFLAISACGGGSDDSENDSGGGDPVEQNPPSSENPPSSPGGLPALAANGPLPTSLNQSFTCDPSKQTPFTLVMDSNGQLQYSDNDGGADTGTYQLGPSGLSLSFSSGVTAVSTAYATAGDLLLGVSLRDSQALDHDCIARAHTVGDKPATNVAFTCGRRNITGESADTFTLYTDGSANWENVFEIPNDTLFETRLGTYLLDIASGSVLMVFKELDSDELLVFSVAASTEQVQVVSGPTEGTGAGITNQACEYI